MDWTPFEQMITLFAVYVLGIMAGIAMHDKIFKEQNRNRRIKDYNSGYGLGRVNSDKSAEEYLNEEK